MQEEENLELKLRVYIQGGGCSGFKYGFSFEEQAEEDDFNIVKFVYSFDENNSIERDSTILFDKILANLVLNSASNITTINLYLEKLKDVVAIKLGGCKNAVTLLVDPISFQYLQKAIVDFKSGIDGEYFAVSNPNAKTTCGCGSSFAV